MFAFAVRKCTNDGGGRAAHPPVVSFATWLGLSFVNPCGVRIRPGGNGKVVGCQRNCEVCDVVAIEVSSVGGDGASGNSSLVAGVAMRCVTWR